MYKTPKADLDHALWSNTELDGSRRWMKTHIDKTQRDKMRELFNLYGGDEARVIRAYAEAEQRGEVPRESDLHSLTAHDYAARLFADGLRKGWIHKPIRAA